MNSHENRGGINEDAVERFVSRATGDEVKRVAEAVKRRAEELGIPPEVLYENVKAKTASEVLKRIPHEDGELTLETRGHVRKDGSTARRGPYWYFRWRAGGRQRVLYVGKTDEPVQLLEEKRARKQARIEPGGM